MIHRRALGRWVRDEIVPDFHQLRDINDLHGGRHQTSRLARSYWQAF